MAAYAGTKTVADHDLWPYFARRYGLEVVGFLEPKPGVSPTTRHLGEVVELTSSRPCNPQPISTIRTAHFRNDALSSSSFV